MSQSIPVTDPNAVQLEQLTAALAFDLASGLSSLTTVMDRYHMTPSQMAGALRHEPFAKLVREAKAKWESDMTVAERVRMKAQFALETCLLPVHNIAQDAQTNANTRLDAVKLISAIAGMSRGDAASADASKFNLVINLGSEQTTVRVGPPVIDQ